MNWNYTSTLPQSNGYEDVMELLKQYTSELYKVSSEEVKQKMINDVFSIYRGMNIFPITYYNNEGIAQEIKKAIEKEVSFEDNVLNLRFNQGQSLCRFLFPNLHQVETKGSTSNSMFARFHNDHKLKRAIKLCFDIKTGVTPPQLRGALELIGGNVATNYKTMNAKALYEKYVPKNGAILDFSAGFGGRMLGALSSKNDYIYVGIEPEPATVQSLHQLGQHIESVTGRSGSYQLVQCGSEEAVLYPEVFDFAFSSPPYFNLESYSDLDSQCYVKYPTLEEWFEGYVKPTIKNIHKSLKTGSFYAVNIADFKVGKNQVNFVDKWVELSQEIGFTFVEQIHMKLQTRRGGGHSEFNGAFKKEGIFVFKK